MTLRSKLIMAFLALAMMTCLSGAMGLFFVGRIGTSVSVFSEITSPLLTESMALVENSNRMRMSFFRGITDRDPPEQMTQRLTTLEAINQGHLTNLRALAERYRYDDIDVRLEQAAQLERNFVSTLRDMIGPYQREQAASVQAQQRSVEFGTKKRELDAIVLALANEFEGKFIRGEDEAKVQVQTGAATVDNLGELFSTVMTDLFPVWQNSIKLMRVIDQIDDVNAFLTGQVNADEISGLEQRARATFKVARSLSQKLAGRLRDAEGKVHLARIEQGIADLEASLFGPDGVFAVQRELLTARTELAERRLALTGIERSYIETLADMVGAVRGLNKEAQRDAVDGISQAGILVAGVTAFTMAAGLLLALFLANRITAPLTRLTNHVADIRTSGEMRQLPVEASSTSLDETATLSRAFNRMIGELADARRRLIESSEAEIRVQYERLNAAVNNMPQGLCMFDANQRLIICNKQYAAIYGLTEEQTKPGTPLRDLLQRRVTNRTWAKHDEDYAAKRLAAIATRQPFYFVNEMSDGHVVAISYQPLEGGGSIATHEDITERRRSEAQIAFMAHHDALTALPNRVRFREEMEKGLSRTARGDTLAVLCLDLDHFKDVNDTLGHPIGDALLKQVAARLKVCLRPTDMVARLGGDEFAVIQCGGEQPVGATALADRLIMTIGEPYDVEGHHIVIGASVGIAVAPTDGNHPDVLLKHADMALYRAKEDGRGTYRFFEAEMDAKMQARRALEVDLRKALILNQFELYYQPLITLETDKVTGFEALLRWRHPTRGMVAPADFISLTEEIGLIGAIGAWVLKQACAEATRWPSDIKIAVNLSPAQFKGRALVLDVVSALGSSGLRPDRLELEITETVLLQETESTLSILNELRALGVRISMDDFGTGYSSLGYLRRFPFDKIKIDRSFIGDLSDKADSVAIIRAVTGLSSSLGIATTAEGVETLEQLNKLRAEGCTEVQGFYFSPPRPAAELDSLMARLKREEKAVA